MEWKSMDSAPKDGTVILGYDAETKHMATVYWNSELEHWSWERPSWKLIPGEKGGWWLLDGCDCGKSWEWTPSYWTIPEPPEDK